VKYSDFLDRKAHSSNSFGFKAKNLNKHLYDFQHEAVGWALEKGRGALFEDCGLGKTLQQLEWSNQVMQKTNKPVLIITPLAVSIQTVAEGERFGIECKRSQDGKPDGITVTNYERLHYFDPADFSGVVCDESSILKNFNGAYKRDITRYLAKVPYRLLATATPSPNDHQELGTSSEALGDLGYMDMLSKYFVNNQNKFKSRGGAEYGQMEKFTLKGHARVPFWRWVASWALALRKPSDIGFDDKDFILPALNETRHLVRTKTLPDGFLFDLPASCLWEQREECRRTLRERCEKAASLVNDSKDYAVIWCHLNAEGDLLQKLIPDAIQVKGGDKPELKEEKLIAFADGKERIMITKPKIGAWGLNLQHCNHVVYFPSHSYEQYYQAVRRCWRFGQRRPVTVDLILTEGQQRVMDNLKRKANQADDMFDMLVSQMEWAEKIAKENKHIKSEEVPSWL
jgi:hypothetical protein